MERFQGWCLCLSLLISIRFLRESPPLFTHTKISTPPLNKHTQIKITTPSSTNTNQNLYAPLHTHKQKSLCPLPHTNLYARHTQISTTPPPPPPTNLYAILFTHKNKNLYAPPPPHTQISTPTHPHPHTHKSLRPPLYTRKQKSLRRPHKSLLSPPPPPPPTNP